MKRKNLITLIVVILVIIALVAISLGANNSPTTLTYCDLPNVEAVIACTDGSYKAISNLLGGGYTIYKPDDSSFQCPVVAPEYITQECSDYLAMCNNENIC